MTLVTIYGQTRILFAIGRDGMLRAFFEMVKRRTQTPVNNTIVVAIVVALLAGPLPIDFLAETTSVGTLVAFLVVSIGVIILRRTAPDLERGFRVPLYPVVPILSVLGCIWIIIGLNPITIAGFVIWGAVVLVWYCYGMSHARTGPAEGRPVTIVVGLPRDAPGRPAHPLAGRFARRLLGGAAAVAAGDGQGRRGVPGVPRRVAAEALAGAPRCGWRRSRCGRAPR